jgi:hypothetical protein
MGRLDLQNFGNLHDRARRFYARLIAARRSLLRSLRFGASAGGVQGCPVRSSMSVESEVLRLEGLLQCVLALCRRGGHDQRDIGRDSCAPFHADLLL